MIKSRITLYLDKWKEQGYPEGIPDEVPEKLMKTNKAPSYKAIALAILRGDNHLTSLGFSAPKSKYYSILKKIEIDNRNKPSPLEQLPPLDI